MHNIMDELNVDGEEKLNVSQGLAVERLTSARLEAKPAPGVMSIEMLMTECIREISNSPCGDSSTGEYCIELLHRAIMRDDQEAREIWQQCLSECVRGWMELHPSRTAAVRLTSEENYVVQAFARFYQVAALKRVQFVCLSSALRYLQASLNSVLLDTLRTYSQPRRTFLSLPGDTGAAAAPPCSRSELWEKLRKFLPGVLEQRLAYLLFHCGLSPEDIVDSRSPEFNDVQEIARL